MVVEAWNLWLNGLVNDSMIFTKKESTRNSMVGLNGWLFLQAKLETKALKAKRPGFTDDRYKETAYYVENGEQVFLLLNGMNFLKQRQDQGIF